MDFFPIWHELQEDRAWQKLKNDLDSARSAYKDGLRLQVEKITQFEHELIKYNKTQLDAAINACNDYYGRFVSQFKND